jgi:phosphoserine aminotransferase
MLDYAIHASNGSMYNTPPCWPIYICGLVFKHLLAQGGLAGEARAVEEWRARRRAGLTAAMWCGVHRCFRSLP